MNYGSIRLSTNPVSATVSISSQIKGTSPLDIINIYPGIYNITLSYPGIDSYNFDTVVIDGKMTVVEFDFILQEVTESHIDLIGTDLVEIPTPPGMVIEQPPNLPGVPGGSGTGTSGFGFKTDGTSDTITTELPPGSSIPAPQTITSDQYGFITDETSGASGSVSGPAPGMPTDQVVPATLDDIKFLLQQLLENSNRRIKKNLSSKFDTGIQTLAAAVPIMPSEDDVSITGYTRIAVKDVLNRLSQELYIINQGPGTIFLRKSNDGKTFTAIEVPIFAGEKGTFNDVYELRIRSDITGTRYRVTEYETTLVINNFDDRVATAAHIKFGLSTYGPHGAVRRASYTVPTGYKAKVNGCYVFIQINTPATNPNLRNVTVGIDSPTIGNLSVMSRSFGNNENALGTVKEGELGFSYTLLTGESVTLSTQDNGTGGSVRYFGSVEITQYFSYPT